MLRMFNLLFLFAAICEVGLVWLGYRQMSGYEVFIRYGAAFVGIVALFYILVWLNGKLIKKEVAQLDSIGESFSFASLDQPEKKSLLHNAYWGHLLILCAAVLFAYGLEANVFPALLGSVFPAILGANILFQNMWRNDMAGQTYEKRESHEQDGEEAELHEEAKHIQDAPYTDAKVMASEIIRQVQSMLKTQEGRIRMESMLCALGALAGYACQRSLLVDVYDQKDLRSESIKLIRTSDGASFFDGEPLNYFLFRSSNSIWELALANVKLEEDLPDPDDIVAYTSQMMGTPEFGIPRLPKNHTVPHLPVEYVKMMWPTVFSVMRLICQNPCEWAAAFGFAIQKIVDEYKEQLVLGTALTIVMESAVPMSRISLFEHFSDQRLL